MSDKQLAVLTLLQCVDINRPADAPFGPYEAALPVWNALLELGMVVQADDQRFELAEPGKEYLRALRLMYSRSLSQ